MNIAIGVSHRFRLGRRLATALPGQFGSVGNFHNHLDFHRNLIRQRTHAYRGSGVVAALAEHFNHQV